MYPCRKLQLGEGATSSRANIDREHRKKAAIVEDLHRSLPE
jgi:hypothetical protein